MMKPEIPLRWDASEKSFLGEETNLSGVQTKWEVLPTSKVTIRTDILPTPYLGLKRRTWDSEEKEGPFGNSTRYDLDDKRQPPINKNLGFWRFKKNGSIGIHVSVTHLQGGFDFFTAQYDCEGLYSRISFMGGQQPGTWPEHQQKTEDNEGIKTRPYKDCFKELVDISKTYGLTAFTNILGKQSWSKEEPTLEGIRTLMHFGLLTHYQDYIPIEKQEEYLETTFEHTTTELEKLFGDDEFVRSNGEVICTLLTLETLDIYAEDKPDLSVPFKKSVKDTFEGTIRYLLGDYYGHLERAGQFNVNYFFDEKTKDLGIQIAGAFSLSDHIRQETIGWGEPFQNEEYTYTLRR